MVSNRQVSQRPVSENFGYCHLEQKLVCLYMSESTRKSSKNPVMIHNFLEDLAQQDLLLFEGKSKFEHRSAAYDLPDPSRIDTVKTAHVLGKCLIKQTDLLRWMLHPRRLLL